MAKDSAKQLPSNISGVVPSLCLKAELGPPRSECGVGVDISEEELERRIEVFGDGDYGVDLTVTLHGRKFRYVPPEENSADAASSAPEVKAA